MYLSDEYTEQKHVVKSVRFIVEFEKSCDSVLEIVYLKVNSYCRKSVNSFLYD